MVVGLRFIVWLLALMAVNSRCIVQSVKFQSGRRTGMSINGGQLGINLTQPATIKYFLQQLEHAMPAVATQSTATKSATPPEVHITVHSDVHGVKLNVKGYTNEYDKDSKHWRNRVAYRAAYKQKGVVTVEDELRITLERVTLRRFKRPKEGPKRPVMWYIVATFYENAVINDNPYVKHVQAFREKQHKKGRLYRINMGVCLRLRDPTNCYFYWHPIDGIIALAVSTIHNQATMSQADWMSMVTKCERKNYVYEVRTPCFKVIQKKRPEHFINLLLQMKPSLSPVFPINAPLNASHYREAKGAYNLLNQAKISSTRNG